VESIGWTLTSSTSTETIAQTMAPFPSIGADRQIFHVSVQANGHVRLGGGLLNGRHGWVCREDGKWTKVFHIFTFFNYRIAVTKR
jgi:hypothetical protein